MWSLESEFHHISLNDQLMKSLREKKSNEAAFKNCMSANLQILKEAKQKLN